MQSASLSKRDRDDQSDSRNQSMAINNQEEEQAHADCSQRKKQKSLDDFNNQNDRDNHQASQDDDNGILRDKKNDYSGYSLQNKNPRVQTIPLVDPKSTNPKDFFAKYISTRTPCMIGGLDLGANCYSDNGDGDCPLSPKDIVELAGKEMVQVERRFSTDETFGQNRTSSRQVVMTVEEFVDKLESSSGDMLYLSPQQQQQQQPGNDNDNNDNDNDECPPPPFLVPCQQLLEAKIIRDTLTLAGNLSLESCNLWMGRSTTGSSSGLHHDYHDNFYLLLRGRKQFRLYSPDTALDMSTHGTIDKVHFNGVISYQHSETAANGKPIITIDEDNDKVGVVAESKSKSSCDTAQNNTGNNDNNDDSEEEEEEFVVGKGFDYQSSDEDNDFDETGSDDFARLEEKEEEEGDDSGQKSSTNEEDERPNNFCRLDVPNSEECRECIVNLKAGEMLYLPAGWFHCVTSFSSINDSPQVKEMVQGDNIHAALNYWYFPPDQLDSFEKPYANLSQN